jgi:hypothetical protein
MEPLPSLSSATVRSSASHHAAASAITRIEYSHGRLDPDEQALLTCFAPSTGVIKTALAVR